jgi:hypothetical protein
VSSNIAFYTNPPISSRDNHRDHRDHRDHDRDHRDHRDDGSLVIVSTFQADPAHRD